ncbi:hypothetical protein ACS0TY_014707 [Phlomoides rotata]
MAKLQKGSVLQSGFSLGPCPVGLLRGQAPAPALLGCYTVKSLLSRPSWFSVAQLRCISHGMDTDLKARGVDLGYEEVIRLEEDEGYGMINSTMCLIEKMLTNKTFNAFGLLEAMNPSRGFTTKEIGKNLFSFQFRSGADMQGILTREPWHFDKNILLLKELGGGEQPSTATFTTATFWVRLYDLPLSARSLKPVTHIGNTIGEIVEVDLASLEGVTHSIRIKVRIDFRKPLRRGIHLELKGAKQIWVEFKYERLPSFFYLCGTLGHMCWECDLADGRGKGTGSDSRSQTPVRGMDESIANETSFD